MTTTTRLIDGKAEAATLREGVRAGVARLATATGRQPGLAVVLVGEDPASQVYVRNKIRATEAAGMASFPHRLPADISEVELARLLDDLAADPAVHGILLQLPLPGDLDEEALVERIPPEKDVDGLTPSSLGRLMVGRPGLVPCTPQGALHLVRKALGRDLAGRQALVIGRSVLFGKPMGQLLLQADCTVTQAHSRSADLPALARGAEILVVAVGRPGLVRGDWVREGACVIDVGINRVGAADGTTRLVGDVAAEEVMGRAAWLTPVPGGVGPMTVAWLMANTLRAAAWQLGRPDLADPVLEESLPGGSA